MHHHRISSAPPPTPIATGRGLRSAAVDDRILTEYLQRSLQVPSLSPPPENHYPHHHHHRTPADVDYTSLIQSENPSVHPFVDSIREFGAAVVGGHGVKEGEVRRVVGVSEKVFGVGREKRRLLQLWGGDGEEEFYWVRPMNDAAEECFREIVREDFHFFRDTMEGISTKLESIAENVGQILSQHMTLKKPSDANGVANAGSILCVQKHNPLNKERNHNVERGCSYRALGLHLATEDLQFRVTSGSRSVSFNVPGGCLIVTVGEQLQEWSGGDLEMVTGEAIFEPNKDAEPSYLIEFMCSPSSLNVEPVDPSEKKIISLMDQLLIILSLTFLHLFWTWISSVFDS